MELGAIKVNFKIFGKEINLSIGKEERQTQTTIVTLPAFTPKESLLKPNEYTLRNFARKPIPHRAITLIRDAIVSLKWQVVNKRLGDKKTYRLQKRAIENIINKPNEHDNYSKFWGQLIDDILIGDNGSAEIVFTGKLDKPIDLYPVNGFSLEYVKGFFADTDLPRFKQVNLSGGKVNGGKDIYLYDEDILYCQHCARNDSPYGLSPIEVCFREIEALINVQNYANTQASNAMPKNALNLGEGTTEKDLSSFRKYLKNEVYGTGETAVFGGTKNCTSLKIGAEGDEELFLQWQSKLITIIALSFGLDPKKFGEGSNTDRSTVAEQNDSVLREAIRPYAKLIQDAINEKIVRRLGLENELKFEFIFEDTLEQKTLKQKLISDAWNNNGMTYAEYREALGLKTIEGEYNNYTQAEMKSVLNQKYAIQGGINGFNGLGFNRKEDVKKDDIQTKCE